MVSSTHLELTPSGRTMVEKGFSMGEIVRIADARASKSRKREGARAATDRLGAPAVRYEAVEYGSGWYHGEAVEASKAPSPRPL